MFFVFLSRKKSSLSFCLKTAKNMSLKKHMFFCLFVYKKASLSFCLKKLHARFTAPNGASSILVPHGNHRANQYQSKFHQ